MHADGTVEVVQILKEHSAAEGGGVVLLVGGVLCEEEEEEETRLREVSSKVESRACKCNVQSFVDMDDSRPRVKIKTR